MLISTKRLLLACARRLQTQWRLYRCRKFISHGHDIHIGARVRFWATHKILIGDHVYIGKDVHIEANCEIGRFCLIANRVAVVGRNDHDFSVVGVPVRYSPWIGSSERLSASANDKAVIGEDVWLGYGVIVLSGVVIGRGAVIAAGSVVSKDIPSYSIAAGVPARVVGWRFKDEDVIRCHELSLENGKFEFSEKGFDHCVIQPIY